MSARSRLGEKPDPNSSMSFHQRPKINKSKKSKRNKRNKRNKKKNKKKNKKLTGRAGLAEAGVVVEVDGLPGPCVAGVAAVDPSTGPVGADVGVWYCTVPEAGPFGPALPVVGVAYDACEV